MKTPSVRALTETFRDLTPARAGLIKRIARAVDDRDALAALLETEMPDFLYRLFHGRPNTIRYSNRLWCRTYALQAINHIVETHGVEPLAPADYQEWTLGPPFEFLNAGDPYATTLVYHRDADALRIGCWGDIAERLPQPETLG